MENVSQEKASDKKTNAGLKEVTSDDVAALKDMARDAREIDGGARPFMEPKAKTEQVKKETRGRKSNAEKAKIEAEKQQTTAQPQSPPFNGADALRPGFKIGSALMVRITGLKSCAFLPEEIEELAQAWGKILEVYGPGFMAKHGPWIAAGMVTAMVGIRISSEMDKEIKIRRDAQKKQQAEKIAKAVDVASEPIQMPEINV